MPPRVMYALIALRFTSSKRAGTFRKLVAVGTVRLRSMLATIAAPAPRIGSPATPDVGAAAFGAPFAAPFAPIDAVVPLVTVLGGAATTPGTEPA